MSSAATYPVIYPQAQRGHAPRTPGVRSTCTTPTPPTSYASPLSYASFPDIVEDIITVCDYGAVLTARSSCHDLRRFVDRHLCAPTLHFTPKGEGWRVSALFPDAVYDVPFFHPCSDAAAQAQAMKRASKVVLDNVPPSPRLDDLLAHLSPEAEVVLAHAPDGPVPAHRLPRVRALTVDLSPNCTCGATLALRAAVGRQMAALLRPLGSGSGPAPGDERLLHAATEVRLRMTPLLSSAGAFMCHAVERALQPGVRRLTVELGRALDLPVAPERFLPELLPPGAPGLEVRVVTGLLPAGIGTEELRQRFAERLSLHEGQVFVELESGADGGLALTEATAGVLM